MFINLFLTITVILAGGFEISAKSKVALSIFCKPSSLDPARITYVHEHALGSLINGKLIKLDDNGNPIPYLAAKWSIKGNTVTFHIAKDACWSDGETIKAEHFVLGMKRVLDPQTASYDLSQMEALQLKKDKGGEYWIRALDEKTLEMKFNRDLKGSILTIVHILTLSGCSPVRGDFIGDNGEFVDKVAFSGPWALKKEEPGRILFTKNMNYHGKDDIRIEDIEVYVVSDPQTEMEMYKNGELNLILFPSPDNVKILQNIGELRAGSENSLKYISFNCKNKFLKNAKIRKALTLAMDRKELIGAILQDHSFPAMALVPPGYRGRKGDFRDESGKDMFANSDMENARKILEEGKRELGVEEISLSIEIVGSAINQKVAQYLAHEMKKRLGIEITINVCSPSLLGARIEKGDYAMKFDRWVADFPVNPISFFAFLKSDSSSYLVNWENKEFNKIVSNAEGESDFGKVISNLIKAESILFEKNGGEFPICPLMFSNRSYGAKPNLKNVKLNAGAFALDLMESYID